MWTVPGLRFVLGLMRGFCVPTELRRGLRRRRRVRSQRRCVRWWLQLSAVLWPLRRRSVLPWRALLWGGVLLSGVLLLWSSSSTRGSVLWLLRFGRWWLQPCAVWCLQLRRRQRDVLWLLRFGRWWLQPCAVWCPLLRRRRRDVLWLLTWCRRAVPPIALMVQRRRARRMATTSDQRRQKAPPPQPKHLATWFKDLPENENEGDIMVTP